MNHCCVKAVPHSDSSFETLADPVADWTARLRAGLTRSVRASDQTLGHLEEEILCQTRGLERQLLEEAAQKKADPTPPTCPVCGHQLTRRTHDHERTYQTRFGPVTIRRLRGWCRRCRAWCFPAGHALGLSEAGSASPSVQERAALVASKMPVAEASAVMERLTGVKLPPATLDREARRQGQRAERKRQELDEQMRTARGAEPMLPRPQAPFTLVIELDAWNIRERDDWGRSAALRRQGREPERWHWVYGGTCLGLDQRVESDRGRPRILSRGTVMTRQGVGSLRDQLFAEAQRHGRAAAAQVLVVADGAVWIWNLTDDRFAPARQRLDYYHASEHLSGRWRTPCIRRIKPRPASGSSRGSSNSERVMSRRCSTTCARWSNAGARRSAKRWRRSWRIWKATSTGWIMRRRDGRASRRAAARWNPPVGSISAGSSDRASSGVLPATRR